MKDYVYLMSILAAFATGVWLASAHYERRAAIDEAARAAAVEKMEKRWTRSTRRRLSTMLCALSVIVCLPGCSTVQVAEPMPAIPETLLEAELPLAKSWSNDFLSLLRSAETDGNAAQ